MEEKIGSDQQIGGLKRFVIVLLWTSFLYIGYQFTCHNQYFPVHYLPLTYIDKKIPFLVWTTIPYFILIGGMYLPMFIRDKKVFYQSLIALTIAVCFNYCIFFFWPTVYERPPLPGGNSLGEIFYRYLMSIDGPANCFPSGHITAPGLGCYFLMRDRPRLKAVIIPVFILLSMSVLTTKQHYCWDILGGLFSIFLGVSLSALWQRKSAVTCRAFD